MTTTGSHIVAFFTSGSAPALGRDPAIRIRNLSTTVLVISSSMTEVGDGCYVYDFDGYDGDVKYSIVIDGNDSTLDDRYLFATNESYIKDMWSSQSSKHAISGSMGAALRDVFDVSVGSWRVLANGTMELMRSGSNDVIASFNLQDIAGTNITDPTTQNPFRRTRT